MVNDAYADVFAGPRRHKTLSLAAEMQWELLPPLTFGTERVVITDGLEPAYDVGGDSFDHAVKATSPTCWSSTPSTTGCRPPCWPVSRSTPTGTPGAPDATCWTCPTWRWRSTPPSSSSSANSPFATAVLVRLDVSTGRLRWINAGHPEPLILRATSLVSPPSCPPSRPLVLQEAKPVVCDTRLEPADRLLPYTDGLTEARSPTGNSSASSGWLTSSAPRWPLGTGRRRPCGDRCAAC